MDLQLLSRAFEDFTKASKSLEDYYRQLHDQVRHLTEEVKLKNTQLKEALLEVKKNRDLLRAILYHLNEAVTVLDSSKNIIILNPSAERLFGISSKDAVGKSLSDIGVIIQTTGSETILKAKKRRYFVKLSRSSISSEGIEVVLIRDITREREIELQAERNQRLISMGEMAVKIAHEIRNPLCSIELFSSMLWEELSNERHKRLARGISQGIRNLENILTNMLLFTKNHKIQKSTVNIRALLKDVLEILKPLMLTRDLKVDLSVRQGIFLMDEELGKQAILNILINALQASPEGGMISICSDTREGYHILEIRDEGPSVPEEIMERIFDPFFTTKEKGTGIGLTISAKIMQAHDGFIKVRNLKKGCEFSLWFPAH